MVATTFLSIWELKLDSTYTQPPNHLGYIDIYNLKALAHIERICSFTQSTVLVIGEGRFLRKATLVDAEVRWWPTKYP